MFKNHTLKNIFLTFLLLLQQQLGCCSMPVHASEVMDRFEGIYIYNPPTLIIQETIENSDHRVQIFGFDLEVGNPDDIWEGALLSPCQSYVLRIIVLPILTISLFFSLIMDFISSKLRHLNVKTQQEKLEAYQTDSTKLANFDQINVLNPPEQMTEEDKQAQILRKRHLVFVSIGLFLAGLLIIPVCWLVKQGLKMVVKKKQLAEE